MAGSLHNIPAALQLLIQDEKENILRASLKPRLGFRAIAEKVPLGIRIGESLTKFRGNLLSPKTTPFAPGTFNADLDNGMTPDVRAAEQFTLTPKLYPGTMNLNLLDNVTGLVDEYTNNLIAQVQQAEASIDILAQNKLFASYLGGHTFADTASTSSTTLNVDDVTGFETKMVNGVPTAVSGSNALSITVNGVANTVTGVSVDGSNGSRNPFGRSGVLTLGSAISASVGHIVEATDKPRIVRPFASGTERASNLAIQAGDLLTLRMIQTALIELRNNAVPRINGKYEIHLSDNSMGQLFQDADFKALFAGAGVSTPYRDGVIYEIMDMRFITCNQHRTMAAASTPTNAKLHFAIVVGAEALLEGEYVNKTELQNIINPSGFMLHDVMEMDGISFIERSPMDRLGLNMTQSWMWIGDFCVPTDSLVTSAVLPTASSARIKRAVALVHGE